MDIVCDVSYLIVYVARNFISVTIQIKGRSDMLLGLVNHVILMVKLTRSAEIL